MGAGAGGGGGLGGFFGGGGGGGDMGGMSAGQLGGLLSGVLGGGGDPGSNPQASRDGLAATPYTPLETSAIEAMGTLRGGEERPSFEAEAYGGLTLAPMRQVRDPRNPVPGVGPDADLDAWEKLMQQLRGGRGQASDRQFSPRMGGGVSPTPVLDVTRDRADRAGDVMGFTIGKIISSMAGG